MTYEENAMRTSTKLADAVEAGKEEVELEALVEVLGCDLAQRAVGKHILPELVDATQRGYWSM